MELTEAQIRRLWTNVAVANDACWEWRGRQDRYGYAAFSASGRTFGGHRVLYELLIGPIPPGLTLDHLCRNTSCVNPAHLEPVTLQENIARCRTTHCKAGHEFTDENTYLYRRRRHCRTCRRETMRRLRS